MITGYCWWWCWLGLVMEDIHYVLVIVLILHFSISALNLHCIFPYTQQPLFLSNPKPTPLLFLNRKLWNISNPHINYVFCAHLKWPSRRTKLKNPQKFFSPGKRGSPTGPDPENRVRDQDTGSQVRPFSCGLQASGEPGHCRAKTRTPWWTSRGVFSSKCPSIVPAEINNTPRWFYDTLKDNRWGGWRLDPKKSRREMFRGIFTFGILWGLWADMPLLHTFLLWVRATVTWTGFVHGQKSRHEIIWIAQKKIPKFVHTTGTVDDFDPRSVILGPTLRRTFAFSNLHEWWIQTTHVRCPIAQLMF